MRITLPARLPWTRLPLYFGIIAVIIAGIIIGVSWALNPWFVFTKNAFSDFGGPQSSCPELYNYGLIVTGLLVIIYSLAIYSLAKNKMEILGCAYMALAGVFLALIGIFPTGTEPHGFVSVWFFLQMYLALIILGLGMQNRGLKFGKETTVIAAIAVPLAIVIDLLWGWPSAAVLEAYGIILIGICTVLVSVAYLGLAKASRRG
ncbi:MAG: DUF998 domain-containing protein [Candidatus Korarchaeota archaeon]|nr:DUF998 domain-containing protein [Thermoproteota archaeon]MCR8463116.1 DUF998 domain-containing protein [Thermoproteota archaeon]MCR8470994.1 DUF998 domain-containing protein [Thermoproteota archaeon]MCR8472273.1 DUF998 domain-containing protein [Thermoproteota archaeon]MCR8473436.1 DUF998 domain-containing protein [Thermoproteota archaeon]